MEREAQVWLNAAEAAALIGTTATALAYWRRKGTGPRYAAVGHHTIRYNRVDVLAWLQSRLIEPATARPQRASKPLARKRKSRRR